MSKGIYKITHTASGRVYVGSSNRLDARKSQHWRAMASGKHHSTKLRNAVAKYGMGAFTFEVIELCDESSLEAREKFWIDELNAVEKGFNIRRDPSCNRGNVPTQEARAKMSAAARGKPKSAAHREAIAASKRGVPPVLAIAASVAARKLRPMTPEQREKISASLKGVKKTPEHIAAQRASVAANRAARLVGA